MGLVYAPNEVINLYKHLQQNLTDCQEVLEELQHANNHLLQRIGNSTNMNSKAIEGLKQIMSSSVGPTIKNTQKIIEAANNDLYLFNNLIQNTGQDFLDEDKLNQMLENYEFLISTTMEYYEKNSIEKSSMSDNTAISETYNKILNDCQNMIQIYEHKKQEIKEKLEKLHRFNSDVNKIFTQCINNLNIVTKNIDGIKNLNVNSISFVHNLSTNISNISKTSTNMVMGAEAYTVVKKHIKNTGFLEKGTLTRKKVSSNRKGVKSLKQWNGEVQRNKIVKNARKIDDKLNGSLSWGELKQTKGLVGRASKIVKGTGIIGGVLAVLDGVETFEQRQEKYGTVNATLDATVHTSNSVAGTVSGTMIGAYIGTFIPIPVVGTFFGAFWGGLIGEQLSKESNKVYDNAVHRHS